MAAMLTRVTALQAAARLSGAAKPSAASWRFTASRVQTASFSSKKDGGDKDERKSKSDLYDPYKLYEESTGSRGYREFNPDLYEGDEFVWEEPEAMMEDKSWPATSNELFSDLLNVKGEPLSDNKMKLVLQESFRRMGYSGIKNVQLPEISVQVAEDNPDREALEIMKLSLLNNGRISMDDKDEIMKSLVDELEHVRKDKTVLFKGLE